MKVSGYLHVCMYIHSVALASPNIHFCNDQSIEYESEIWEFSKGQVAYVVMNVECGSCSLGVSGICNYMCRELFMERMKKVGWKV